MIQLTSRGLRNAPVKNDPEHVHDDRGHEQQRRPVVHLPHDQAAADVEREVQRRLVRLATSRCRAAARSCRRSVTSVIDGSKNSARNVPVSSRTMNE